MRALLLVLLALLCGCAASAQGGPSATWRTYRNAKPPFSVHYPRSWHADAIRPEPGVVYTTFAPPGGSPAIHIYTYKGTGPGTDNPIPDVNCHRVTIHGVHGKRCRALNTGAPVTVLVSAGRTYRISADAGIGTAVYDRLVNSFRLIKGRR